MSSETIKDAIRELADKKEEVFGILCKVSNVDTSKKVCDCEPLDGKADILGVRLMTDNKKGFLIIPKDGSTVCVSMINNFTGVIVMFSEIDEIQLNSDNYGGIIKASEITDKINNLENKVNSIINTFNTHTHIASSFGSPTTPPATPIVGTLTPTIKNDIINNTVKHGNGN